MAYSSEEIKAFKKKDKLNARMSALKAASIIYEGKAISFEKLEEYVNKVYTWVFQDQEEVDVTEEYTNAFIGEKAGDDLEYKKEKALSELYDIWHKSAKAMGLPLPTDQQCVILETIYDIYKQQTKKKVSEGKLLRQIRLTHGAYPVLESSIQIVLDTIDVKSILKD